MKKVMDVKILEVIASTESKVLKRLEQEIRILLMKGYQPKGEYRISKSKEEEELIYAYQTMYSYVEV